MKRFWNTALFLLSLNVGLYFCGSKDYIVNNTKQYIFILAIFGSGYFILSLLKEKFLQKKNDK